MSLYLHDYNGKPRLENIPDEKEEHILATIGFASLVAVGVAVFIISLFI